MSVTVRVVCGWIAFCRRPSDADVGPVRILRRMPDSIISGDGRGVKADYAGASTPAGQLSGFRRDLRRPVGIGKVVDLWRGGGRLRLPRHRWASRREFSIQAGRAGVAAFCRWPSEARERSWTFGWQSKRGHKVAKTLERAATWLQVSDGFAFLPTGPRLRSGRA